MMCQRPIDFMKVSQETGILSESPRWFSTRHAHTT
jgi:hypothetical protein